MSAAARACLDRGQQGGLLVGRGHAGLVLAGGPGGGQAAVEDLGGADHGDALALDRDQVGPVGLVGVAADPDHRELGRLGRGQGVAQADQAEVLAVVVGHGGHVDAGRLEGGQGRRRGPEGEVLGGRGAALGDGRLEIYHGQVGPLEHVGDRAEGGGRVGRQPGLDRALEVDVAAEGQGDRLAGRLPGVAGLLGRGGGRPGGRRRGGGRLGGGGRRGRAGVVVAPAGAQQQQRRQGQRGDHVAAQRENQTVVGWTGHSGLQGQALGEAPPRVARRDPPVPGVLSGPGSGSTSGSGPWCRVATATAG